MTYEEVRKFKTTVGREDAQAAFGAGCVGIHESTLRAFHILAKVKWLLEKNTAPDVVLELIAFMEFREPA